MNKNSLFILLVSLFVIRHDRLQDVAIRFDGLSEESISAMYKKAGYVFDFVDKATYEAFLASQQIDRTPVIDPVRQQAILDAKDKGKTADERLDALIKALDLK